MPQYRIDRVSTVSDLSLVLLPQVSILLSLPGVHWRESCKHKGFIISSFFSPLQFLDGTLQIEIPLEVALLLKLKPEAGETSAVVALLDWYDLDYELVLVLERPVPCMDLIDYLRSRRSALPEAEAKVSGVSVFSVRVSSTHSCNEVPEADISPAKA